MMKNEIDRALFVFLCSVIFCFGAHPFPREGAASDQQVAAVRFSLAAAVLLAFVCPTAARVLGDRDTHTHTQRRLARPPRRNKVKRGGVAPVMLLGKRRTFGSACRTRRRRRRPPARLSTGQVDVCSGGRRVLWCAILFAGSSSHVCVRVFWNLLFLGGVKDITARTKPPLDPHDRTPCWL